MSMLGADRSRSLTSEERRLVLRAIVGLAIPLALIVLLISVTGFFIYRHEANQRIAANKAALKRETALRVQFNRRINQFVFDQCVLGEVRDIIIVDQLQAAKRRARATLPAGSELLQDSLSSLDDGINALEPDDEQDCTPPGTDKPRRKLP